MFKNIYRYITIQKPKQHKKYDNRPIVREGLTNIMTMLLYCCTLNTFTEPLTKKYEARHICDDFIFMLSAVSLTHISDTVCISLYYINIV